LRDFFGSTAAVPLSRIRNRMNRKNDATNVRRISFEREYRPRVENTKDVQVRFNYEDHYSARLNKCFFLEISSSYDREGGKLTSSKIMRLVELNDNKDYGVFVSGLSDRGPPIACLLEEKICQSESEWRQLLEPFMEN
jgi:hypothetical protein